MTLGFSTHWPPRMGDLAGKPTYFIEKIWRGLETKELTSHSRYWMFKNEHLARFGHDWDDTILLRPKLHTIRYDPHGRWTPGMKIHMVINNRTKDRFQFAPVLKCTGVQKINIEYKGPIIKRRNRQSIRVYVDGNFLGSASWSFEREEYEDNMFDQNIQKLTENNGFASVDHFFRWFNEDTKPKTKIIHWTDTRY